MASKEGFFLARLHLGLLAGDVVKPVVIKEWDFVRSGDAYTAPELRGLVLSGIVYGHPLIKDGECVTTSLVLSIKGRVVETRNTTYILTGDPSSGYAAWAQHNGVTLP